MARERRSVPRDYIDIPVNFIWRITRNGLLNPYLFMGPVLGFNSGKNIKLNIGISTVGFFMEFRCGN